MIKEIIQELAGRITIADLIISPAGILVLAIWLIRTSFGVHALDNAPARRNNMPIYLVFIPFILWIATTLALSFAKKVVSPDLSGWHNAFTENLIMLLSSASPVTTVFIIVKLHFARGLRGFGFNSKTISRDLPAAFLNLLAILPVIFTAILLVIIAGKLIVGPEFEMPRHENLKEIMEYPQISLRVLIIILAVFTGPFTEEVLFRGVLQTLLRSYIGRPWPAIIFTSLIFATVFHVNPQHWPAIFVLSLCLGYSYEKSGSIWRPIFIHSMFNALSVAIALFQ
jgi:membrane protease YdiL (CAAX protease family)